MLSDCVTNQNDSVVIILIALSRLFDAGCFVAIVAGVVELDVNFIIIFFHQTIINFSIQVSFCS